MLTPSAALQNPWKAYPVRKELLGWMVIVHLIGLVVVPIYFFCTGVVWATVAFTAVCWLAVHLSITIGHRLYAHRAFQARSLLHLVLVLLQAAAFQSSALWWNARHIQHHAYSDTARDPYTVRHGFWWAHMLWIFFVPKDVPLEGRALSRNAYLRWQHDNYWWLASAVGIALPTALAAFWGDALGAFLLCFTRLTAQYHATWCINSVSHTWGHWLYKAHRTPRTNVAMALLNVGEGYHERHHLAERDFRLGPKWYHLDMGKWVILLCSLGGWAAHSLVRVSEADALKEAERQRALTGN